MAPDPCDRHKTALWVLSAPWSAARHSQLRYRCSCTFLCWSTHDQPSADRFQFWLTSSPFPLCPTLIRSYNAIIYRSAEVETPIMRCVQFLGVNFSDLNQCGCSRGSLLYPMRIDGGRKRTAKRNRGLIAWPADGENLTRLLPTCSIYRGGQNQAPATIELARCVAISGSDL